MANKTQNEINDLIEYFFDCRQKHIKNIIEIQILKKNTLPLTVWNELTDIEHRSKCELTKLTQEVEESLRKHEGLPPKRTRGRKKKWSQQNESTA